MEAAIYPSLRISRRGSRGIALTEKQKAFYAKFDMQMAEWRAQIDRLKGRHAIARARFLTDDGQPLVGAFQRKHSEARARLQALRAASDEASEDLVAGMKKILAEGETAYHAAVSRLQL